SKVGNYVMMSYDSFSDFKDFINKVKIEGTLISSYIDSRDIALFAPQISTIRFDSEIQHASLSGTVKHIVANEVILKTLTNTNFAGAFTIDGLPNIEKTKFDFKISTVQTSADDLEKLIPSLTRNSELKLPKQLHQLGQITYSGSASGYYHAFDLNGNAQTDLGEIETESTIQIKPLLSYSGRI